MRKAIRHILTHCGGLKSGENIFIIYDESTRIIAEAFIKEAKRYTWAVIGCKANVSRHGEEPSGDILSNPRPIPADLTISLCQFSMAHSRWRRDQKRFLSLPGYSQKLLKHPAVMVDYEAQAPNVRRFADAFTNGNEIRVVAERTDVTMDIINRRGNYCPGFVRKHGDLGSPPDIEANVAPIEGSAKGRWFNDLNELAECGVGLNPLSKEITGNMLLDEGVFGSVHFGLGSNHTIGGQRDVGYHTDYVMPNASLWVDGIQMLKDGELC